MGDTAAWGYDAGLRVRTDEVGDITITIALGDTVEFPDGLTGSSSNTETHFVTIDALGINVAIGPGEDASPGFTISPIELGTHLLYCSAHPDPAAHGNVFIVVNAPGPPPAT